MPVLPNRPLSGRCRRLAAASLAQADDTPQQGGTLNFLVDPEPPVLLAIAHTAGLTTKVTAKTNEGLLAYDFDLNPKPKLATSWEVSADGLRYTFHLREGVKWHDGQPFTSTDVERSIELLKQYHPRGRNTFANVDHVETPDDLTAVIVLSKPAPYLLTAFAAQESPIVPAHVFPAGQDPAQNPAVNASIGTLPAARRSRCDGRDNQDERAAPVADGREGVARP